MFTWVVLLFLMVSAGVTHAAVFNWSSAGTSLICFCLDWLGSGWTPGSGRVILNIWLKESGERKQKLHMISQGLVLEDPEHHVHHILLAKAASRQPRFQRREIASASWCAEEHVNTAIFADSLPM